MTTTATTPVGHAGAAVTIEEKKAWLQGGGQAGATLLTALALTGFSAWVFIRGIAGAGPVAGIIGILLFLIALLLLSTLRVVNPGETMVAQFFGRYVGTVRQTGFILVAPLVYTKKVSIRVRNFETKPIKVNDLNGNPINIGAIIVWQIADTAKATFAVEDVDEFIYSQAESALRHVATTHPYDSTDITTVPSLSGSTDIVSAELADEVATRAAIAGIEIIEARISALSYAPEIAQAMLQRQQASAIVDAREKIVEGAVSMVDSALNQLEERHIVDLDPERRAAMVSNLLVVLCSDKATSPVVNAGSLYN